MGKSPGKWIRTFLFRKKVSGSGVRKGREPLKVKNEKDVWVAGKELDSEVAVDHPYNSSPLAANADRNPEISEAEKSLISNVACTGESFPTNYVAEGQSSNGLNVGADSANALDKCNEEQAAIKIQAAFRGYLARRAFWALKGIIRLQALIRGHLVRRQAVATFCCLQGIVKLQALARGRRARHSDMGMKSLKNFNEGSQAFGATNSFQVSKLFAIQFVRKILSSSPKSLPLLLQYGEGEPNSAYMWLERWTYMFFVKLAAPCEGSAGSKGMAKQGTSRMVETQACSSKRTIRKIHGGLGFGSTALDSQFEKTKRDFGKSAHSIDEEHPQNELEKVKRNLRKVSNSTADANAQQDANSEKEKRSLKRVAGSPPKIQVLHAAAAENIQNDSPVESAYNVEMVTTLKPTETDGSALLHSDHPAVESQPLEIIEKDGNNITTMKEELGLKEGQMSHENQKTRRTSFPEKPELLENGLQKTATLPSYMATTESSKAKLRAQGSPRFVQDGAEKNGLARRHSLPSLASGKASSPSLRAQRHTQTSGKSAVRDKVTQVEWRR